MSWQENPIPNGGFLVKTLLLRRNINFAIFYIHLHPLNCQRIKQKNLMWQTLSSFSSELSLVRYKG